MAESVHRAGQWRSIRERERGRWSRRKRRKQRVVHRQEISPGKLIPKHKSHRPPQLLTPMSWSGFIYSSFSVLHTELQNHLWREKSTTDPKPRLTTCITDQLSWWYTSTASLWPALHQTSVYFQQSIVSEYLQCCSNSILKKWENAICWNEVERKYSFHSINRVLKCHSRKQCFLSQLCILSQFF